MNSIAIVIVLIISLVGIGSIFWMRTYYNPATRQLNKTLLLASISNVFNSGSTDNTESLPKSRITSSLRTNEEEEIYTDAFTGFNSENNSLRRNLSNIFANNDNDESRFDSLKSAVKDSVKNDNEIEDTSNYTISSLNTQNTSSLNSSTYDNNTIITASAEERMREKEKETLEEDEYKSPDAKIQEAIEKTYTPRENKEILELYNDNEIMTPYEDFEFKNEDQRRIENASNKIDKFYGKLTELSIDKITNRNKNTEEQDLSKDKKEETGIQSTFITNSTPENDTILTFNPEAQKPISPVKEEKTEPKPKSNLTVTAKINNRSVELKRGDSVIFHHNNETYSSLILDVRPEEIYVNYRRERIWVNVDRVKKKFD